MKGDKKEKEEGEGESETEAGNAPFFSPTSAYEPQGGRADPGSGSADVLKLLPALSTMLLCFSYNKQLAETKQNKKKTPGCRT